MDRFTWGVVGAVALLSLAAIVSVFAVRSAQPAPDLSTPEGVVIAYIQAVQNKDADRAWELLTGPEAVSGPPRSAGIDPKDSFRNEVNNAYRSGERRLRIVDSTITGDTAKVTVEVTNVPAGPGIFFDGSNSHPVNFSLVRRDGAWRINSAPYIWELG